MIAKQTKGKSFRGLLNYLQEKEGAQLIGSNMVGQNARELAAEFRFSRELNRNVERVVYHASLSLPKHERLDNETWSALALDYLTQMGFDYNQYAVYRHYDQDHDHVHVVASRIKLDGSCVHDSWDYRRSEAVIRQLENSYGLEAAMTRDQGKRSPTTGERRLTERTGEQSIREKLQNVIDTATQSSPTMPRLIKSLKQQGVDAQVIYTRKGKVKGITYALNEITFSGTQLGRDYTFQGLQKHRGIEYSSGQDQAIQLASQEQPISPEPTLEHLIEKELQKEPSQIQQQPNQQKTNQQQPKSKSIDIEYEL